MTESIQSIADLAVAIVVPPDSEVEPEVWLLPLEEIQLAFEIAPEFDGKPVEVVAQENGGQERLLAWAEKVRVRGLFNAKSG